MKPNVLIGLTGCRGLFTPDILREMAKYNDRPIIFAMSNPTSRLECTAEEAQKYTGETALNRPDVHASLLTALSVIHTASCGDLV